MKAAICDKFGEPTEVLYEGDIPTPKCEATKVLVKTSFAVIHNHNVSLVRGEYGYKPQLPYVGGSEASGVIVEVGDKVKGFKVGDRVTCTQGTTGTWAEYFLAAPGSLTKVPSSISDEEAAQLITMPLSALLLLDAMDIKEGNWFIYNGANGLVGQMLAAICKAKGINMLKLVRRAEAKQWLEKQGYTDIVSTGDKDWRQQVKNIIGKGKVQAGVDNIGGWAAGQVFSMLAFDGVLWCFGNLTAKPIEIKSDIIFNDRTIKGFWATRVLERVPAEKLLAFNKEIVEYVATKQIVLPVGAVYTFANVKEAFKAQLDVKEGKILLCPTSTKSGRL